MKSIFKSTFLWQIPSCGKYLCYTNFLKGHFSYLKKDFTVTSFENCNGRMYFFQ
ncbi:hypothetical protein RIR_e2371_A0A2N1N4Y2_9GLOM [Rhizophagus irregularis DAOM 181602=DAOM 197198]|nr:hypothetical protein RIR_e2371_A0A2N1N4Y2_9GLOM [Rhizophagus irregularis DAOM 181602=DAOM 197198]